jgi:zinc-ribbon domain
LTACSNCGRELPEGAIFCPDCGTKALDYSITPSNVSPSHFNSGITATAPPVASSEEQGFASPPPPVEEKRSSGRRGLVLAVIAILVLLLVGAVLGSGLLGSGGGPAGPVVNSASNPFTGEQLYAAYASNQTQADASYTNKTVYIQDSLDFGAVLDVGTGHYYSYVDSGAVVLFWSSQSQVSQLSPGTTVLARCSVEGVQPSLSSAYVLSLQDCDLINVQSQISTASISVANV